MKTTIKQFRKYIDESIDKKTVSDIFQKFSGHPKDEQVALLQMMVSWLREKTTSTDADFRRQFAGIKNVKAKKTRTRTKRCFGFIRQGTNKDTKTISSS